MDNNEKLKNLNDKLNDVDERLERIEKYAENNKNNLEAKSFRNYFIGAGILSGIVSCSIVFLMSKINPKYEKVIVYNDDNAVIFDITECNESLKVKDANVIYVDEDKGISANDIAVTLVGEDGCVYYYNSETKEKELLNKK